MKQTYLVNEIYPCLQGEGFNLGKPSVLVRLQICNLRCTWCDTPYTHTLKSDPVDSGNPEAGQNFKRHDLRELCDTIRSFDPIHHVILSGGEPTLQNLAPIADELGRRYSFEVESNGTRIPHKQLPGFGEEDYKKFQWNISPKGSAAGQKLEMDALQHWGQLSKKQKNVFFKFVVREQNDSDMEEVLNLVNQLQLENDRVFLMPEGTDQNSQLQQTWLHDICLKYGFRYTPRLHVLLFGSRRGV